MIYLMTNNRKSYALVYLSETTPEAEITSIETILKKHKIDYDLFDSRVTYREWCANRNSINPSLFISNEIHISNEYEYLNKKLEDSVLLLIGELKEITQQKLEGRTKEVENLLKKFGDGPSMIKYLNEVAFSSPKFTEKVFNKKENQETRTGTPPLEKQNPVEQSKENNNKQLSQKEQSNQAQFQKTGELKTAPIGSSPNLQEKEMEQPVSNLQQNESKMENGQIPGEYQIQTPFFDHEDDERLQEQLKSITEVANKTKKGEEKSAAPPISKENAIVYEENPYHKRSRHLQKQVFAKQKWENHRTIGVWSPLHRMGVTSFTINFALFLAENRVYTAVLEGLTEHHALKSWLQRYTSIPSNWSSYANAIHSDGLSNEIEWMYRDVMFLPLDTNDPQFEWNALSLESYMTTTSNVDITLVDFPTGKMTTYTEDSLHYIDELWILIDDAAQETLSWKEYIQKIQQQINVPIYLLFNKTYKFSQVKRLSKEYQLPLLTELPALHEETMRNYYETNPLYCKKEVQEKLQVSFSQLGKHLLGDEFVINEKIPSTQKKKWPAKMLKILKPD